MSGPDIFTRPSFIAEPPQLNTAPEDMHTALANGGTITEIAHGQPLEDEHMLI